MNIFVPVQFDELSSMSHRFTIHSVFLDIGKWKFFISKNHFLNIKNSIFISRNQSRFLLSKIDFMILRNGIHSFISRNWIEFLISKFDFYKKKLILLYQEFLISKLDFYQKIDFLISRHTE